MQFNFLISNIFIYICINFQHITTIDVEDAFLTVPELLSKYGYLNEVHTVITIDGYILTIHRIANGRNNNAKGIKQPVIIGHGLGGSSTDFIVMGPEKALGYMLADEGYDVWLINYRGNKYALKHKEYNLYSGKFWNFSFHEMGIYDLSAVIDYVINMTGFEKVTYLGHSQGCTAFYVLLSEKPEYNNKINLHIGYAPGVFMCHKGTKILRSSLYFKMFLQFLYTIDGFVIIPYFSGLNYVIYQFCKWEAPTANFCKFLVKTIFNFSENQIDENFPIYISNLLSSTSSRSYVHYMQSLISCEFGKYARSPFEKRINYNLNNVKVPIFVFYGEIDSVANYTGVEYLGQRIPGGFKKQILIKNWGHLDFVLGKDAKTVLYKTTIQFLHEIFL